MRIDRFQMERTQCLYENEVRWNLSESGVLPLRVEELLDGDAGKSELLETALKYSEADGSDLLRERIALFYPGATAENVRVTTGTSEANYMTLWGLLEDRDRAAILLPAYLQGWGVARAYAGRTDAFRTVESGKGTERRWALDVDSLKAAVSRRTRVIMVTNPANPTGGVLTEEEMDAVVAAARRTGAWIVSDEVYRGAELDSHAPTPTFWGRYPRVIVTAGLSKAFGLPGLRIGWIVAPKAQSARLREYQDYTTLTPSMLSDRLARRALEPARREQILGRTRAIVRRQWPEIQSWVRKHEDILDVIPPRAGAIALVRYRLPIGSVAFFDRLREEKSVLITPGAHFGIGKYIRVGFGYEIGKIREGLAKIDEVIADIQSPAQRRRRAG